MVNVAEPSSRVSGPVATPAVWLGAEPVGGLTLPDAMPTADHVYAPRAVWIDDDVVIAADTGNHRLLIWHGAPASHSPADVVLGQPDFTTEGPQAAGRGPEAGLHLPTGVIVHGGRLIVADAWNHRILVWDEVPETSDTAPSMILGQPSATDVTENRGGGCGPLGFYWPFGLAMVGDRFYVADTGNRRVLVWDDIPEPDQEPAVVMGQPDAYSRDENRGMLGPDSFRWPHDIAGTLRRRATDDTDVLWVADAGNHRLLGWTPGIDRDRPADHLLGQPDFTTATEWPYSPQTASALRFPYAIDVRTESSVTGPRGATDAPRPPEMAVADTANNRVLLWDTVPTGSHVPADHVLGQPDFGANGENRWTEVAADTFCWPYGLSFHGRRLAVADSGNNRITIWEL